MFEVSRSVKPWDHMKDEVVAPMMDAARRWDWLTIPCTKCDGRGVTGPIDCQLCSGRGWTINPEAIELVAEIMPYGQYSEVDAAEKILVVLVKTA